MPRTRLMHFNPALLAPPARPSGIVRTRAIEEAELKTRLTIACGDICALVGPSGTGKTTCLELAATDPESPVEFVYCAMPDRGQASGVTVTIYQQMFKVVANGTEAELRFRILDRLAEGDLGLACDEVHHLGVAGMQVIRALHDQITLVNGTGFPTLVGGIDLRSTIGKVPELDSRIARWVSLHIVDSTEGLREMADNLHPRFAASPDKVVARVDQLLGQGTWRLWKNVAKHVDFLQSSAKRPRAAPPLTAADVLELVRLIGK